MRSIERTTVSAAIVALTACTTAFDLPPETRISCTADGTCPSGFVCKGLTGWCISDAIIDDDPPALDGPAVLWPAVATLGTTVRLRFRVTEPLAAPPEVRLETSEGDVELAYDEDSDRDSLLYVFTLVPSANLPQGDHLIVIDLVDLFENRATGLGNLPVHLDYDPPLIEQLDWVQEPWRDAAPSVATLAFVGTVEPGLTLVSAQLLDQDLSPLADVTDTTEIIGATLTGTADLDALGGRGPLLVDEVVIEAIVSDAAGNHSPAAQSRTPRLPLDDTPPLPIAFGIAGPDATTAYQVTVRVEVGGAVQVFLSGDLRENAVTGIWVPAPESQSFPLPDGESLFEVLLDPGIGDKTIVATFRDGAGNEADPISTSVELLAATDSAPPNYVAPLDGALLADPDVTLQWTGRRGAAWYEIEIAPEPTFLNPTVYQVSSPATELPVHLEEDVTYYWRVRADVTALGEYSSVDGGPAHFNRLGDAVHVFCPAGELCADSAWAGNRTRPLRTLAGALGLASQHQRGEVRVAARGGGEPYKGSVELLSGVDLLGGYSADFQTRDPNTAVTVVQASERYVARAVATAQSTVVDGLTLRGIFGFDDTVGLEVLAGANGLLVRNCVIEAGPSLASSYGVAVVDGSVELRRCTIAGGESSERSIGIYLGSSGAVELVNSIVVTAGGDETIALADNGCASTISNNTLVAGPAASATLAIATLPDLESPCAAGAAGTSVTNTLLVTRGAAPARWGVQALGVSNPWRALENSAFVDLGADGVYLMYEGLGTGCAGDACTTLTEVEMMVDWRGGSDRDGGNIEMVINPFVDDAGEDFHLRQGGLLEVDWRNLIYGGKDTSGDNCGDGADSCGGVSDDRDGAARTLDWPGGSDPTNSGAEGVSMGAHEND